MDIRNQIYQKLSFIEYVITKLKNFQGSIIKLPKMKKRDSNFIQDFYTAEMLPSTNNLNKI